MKITFITSNFPPKICGVGDYTYFLSEELVKRGFEINVFKLDKDTFVNIKKIKPDLVNIQYTPALYRVDAMGLGIVLLAFWVRILGIRCITTFHERYSNLSLNPKLIFLSLIERINFFLIILASESVIFCAEHWVKDYQHYFFWLSKKVYHLPVGSNIPNLPLNEDDRRKKRSVLGAKDETIILGTFGRVKNSVNKFYLDTLLTSFETLKRKGYDVILLLIGWPSKQKNLYSIYKERVMSDYIKPVGSLPREEVSEYLNIVDIYLAPFADGLTTRKGTIMAAMHHSLPIISIFANQTENIFISCRAITLVQSNKKFFIGALINLAEDRQGRMLLGKEAEFFYENNFSWNRITDEFIKIIGD